MCHREETNRPGKQQPGIKKYATGWVKDPDGGAMLSINPECDAFSGKESRWMMMLPLRGSIASTILFMMRKPGC